MSEHSQSQELHLIARAIIIDKDKLLVCQNKGKSHFYLPGGHVEFKEPVKVALLRELEEELGLPGTIKRFLGVQEYAFDTTGPKSKCHVHEVNIYFEVEVKGLNSSENPVSPEEHQNFTWLSIDQLDQPNFFPSGLKATLIDWLHADFDKALKALDN